MTDKIDYYPQKPTQENPQFFVANGDEVEWGGGYQQLGHFSKEMYDAAIRQWEKDCDAWNGRSYIREQLKNIQKAKDTINENQGLIKNAYDNIKKTSEFNEGDLVLLKEKIGNNQPFETKVYIRYVGVNDDGSIYYHFYKMKKDGKISAHRYQIEDKLMSITKV
jgi:hypothetical protein